MQSFSIFRASCTYLLTYVGEERVDVRSSLVHAGIVTEAVSMSSEEMLSVALLSRVLGTQPGVEYSPKQPASKLYSAASSAVTGSNFAVCSTTTTVSYLSP